MTGAGILRFPMQHAALEELVRSALEEDGAFNDLTTIATVVSDRRSRGTLVARENGVICGVPLALEAFRQLDGKVSIRVDHEDGSRVKAGEAVLFVTGHARALLSAERVALNYLQRLSGIATLTAQYVDAVKGHERQDSRHAQDDARLALAREVRGARRRRHEPPHGSLDRRADQGQPPRGARRRRRRAPSSRAREHAPRGIKIEVECDRIDQVSRAVEAGADIILLDNMSPPLIAECVRARCRPRDSRGVGRRDARHRARDRRDGRRLDLRRRAHALGAVARLGPRLRVIADNSITLIALPPRYPSHPPNPHL